MKKTVFISHSHVDASVVNIIRDALEENGIDCWVCSRDIDGGEDWADKIVDAIKSCKVFLFLQSKNSAASKQCYKEINLADASNCAMICVNIDNSELVGGAVYHFVNLQTMFVDQNNLSDKLDKVISRVRGLINGDQINVMGKVIKNYHFDFKLDLKGKSTQPTGLQKLQLIEIIAKRDKDFNISINLDDENINSLESQCYEIEKRIANDEDVSDQDIQYLTKAQRLCEKQKGENLRKAMAAKLFLLDINTRALCQLNELNTVWNVLKEIFEYQPRFDIQEKANDRNHYSMLDIVLPKEKLCFSAPIRNEIIAERREAMGFFCEIGLLPIVDLGVNNIKEILTYFYMFLVDELIAGNEMMQLDQTRDLLNYYFGYK